MAAVLKHAMRKSNEKAYAFLIYLMQARCANSFLFYFAFKRDYFLMRCVITQSNQPQFDLFIYLTLESINLLLDGDSPCKKQSKSNTLKPDP